MTSRFSSYSYTKEDFRATDDEVDAVCIYIYISYKPAMELLRSEIKGGQHTLKQRSAGNMGTNSQHNEKMNVCS